MSQAFSDLDGPLAGRLLLVVDDAADWQYLVSSFLRQAGAEVECAGNGAEAISLIAGTDRAARNYDAIVMDLQMPILSGLSTTRILRGAGYDGRIVAITSSSRNSDRELSRHAGCDYCMGKPIERKALVQLLSELLDRLNEDDELPLDQPVRC